MQRVFEIEHYFWEVCTGWDMNLKKLPALLSKLTLMEEVLRSLFYVKVA